MRAPAVYTASTRALAAGFLGALALAYAAGAFAQSIPPFSLFRGPGNVVLGTAVLNSSRNALNAQTAQVLAAALGGASARRPPPAPPGPPPTLTYTPDARLSDWTRVRMIDALSPGDDPELRRRIEQAFAGNAVLEDFDRFMAARGYSSHDIADDTAELLLLAWQIVTNGTATKLQAQGVHEQIRAVFLNTPQMQGLNDADRQLMAEQIAYQVVLTSSARTESLHDAHAADQRQLQQTAAAILREHGIEASQVHLTDQGFHR